MSPRKIAPIHTNFVGNELSKIGSCSRIPLGIERSVPPLTASYQRFNNLSPEDKELIMSASLENCYGNDDEV